MFQISVLIINYLFLIQHVFIKHLLHSTHKGGNGEVNTATAPFEIMFLLGKTNTHTQIDTQIHTSTQRDTHIYTHGYSHIDIDTHIPT